MDSKYKSRIDFNNIINMFNRTFPNDINMRKSLKDIIKNVYNISLVDYSNQLNGITCSICLENFNKNNFILKLDCQHIYHHNCLDKWFRNKLSCPLCRR